MKFASTFCSELGNEYRLVMASIAPRDHSILSMSVARSICFGWYLIESINQLESFINMEFFLQMVTSNANRMPVVASIGDLISNSDNCI